MGETSPSRPRAKGFLSLPLELRRVVYRCLTPRDQIMYFPLDPKLWEEKAIIGLWATNEGIYREIKDDISSVCEARLYIDPMEEMDLPMKIEWDRFQQITVQLEYSPDCEFFEEVGVRQVVSLLRQGSPELLPAITMQFCEGDKCCVPKPRRIGELSWESTSFRRQAEEYDSEDSDDFDESTFADDYATYRDSIPCNAGVDRWLRSDSFGAAPISVDVLDCFLDLPPCKSAFVERLRFSKGRRRGFAERFGYTKGYLEILWITLTFWLEGERDGIELNQAKPMNTRIQQLSRKTYKGNFYWCCTERKQREMFNEDIRG